MRVRESGNRLLGMAIGALIVGCLWIALYFLFVVAPRSKGPELTETLSALHGALAQPDLAERVQAIGRRPLENLFKSELVLEVESPARLRVVAAAARHGGIDFASPGEAVAIMQRWAFPGYRVVPPQGQSLTVAIAADWSPAGVAFYAIWTCWPTVAVRDIGRDPWLAAVKDGDEWPDLGACTQSLVDRLTASEDPAARQKIAADAIALIRQKAIATLQNSRSCEEKGADDCALLLLQLAAIAPLDAVLPELTAHVERLLGWASASDHAHRRLAIANVKVAMALKSLAAPPVEAPLRARLLDRAESVAPDAVRWIRRWSGIAPAPTPLATPTIRRIFEEAVEKRATLDKLAASESDRRRIERARLDPLHRVEDAELVARNPAIDLLVQEVRRRAQAQPCDERLSHVLRRDDIVGGRQYVLGSQLAFAYSAERARKGDSSVCWDLSPPARSERTPPRIEVMALLGGLIGNEDLPFAHVEAETALAELCRGAESRDPGCGKLAPGLAASELPDPAARFSSRTVPADRNAMAAFMPGETAGAVWASIEQSGCVPDKFNVWTHPQSSAVLVQASCVPLAPSPSGEKGALDAPRHGHRVRPPVIAAQRAEALRVIGVDAFVNGRPVEPVAVTDLDQDGRLEVWQQGVDCRHDDVASAHCQSDGIRVEEVFGAVLARFRDQRSAP